MPLPGASYIPRRGDFVWIDLDPTVGREMRKRRPALVLSHDLHHELSGLAIITPITSRQKGYPFEIAFTDVRDMDEGAVLVDHIRSVDWRERRAEFIAEAPLALVRSVRLAINELI